MSIFFGLETVPLIQNGCVSLWLPCSPGAALVAHRTLLVVCRRRSDRGRTRMPEGPSALGAVACLSNPSGHRGPLGLPCPLHKALRRRRGAGKAAADSGARAFAAGGPNTNRSRDRQRCPQTPIADRPTPAPRRVAQRRQARFQGARASMVCLNGRTPANPCRPPCGRGPVGGTSVAPASRRYHSVGPDTHLAVAR